MDTNSKNRLEALLRSVADPQRDYDIPALTDKIMAFMQKPIQDALGTAETGEALVEVARNAHRCEMELASTINFDDEPFGFDGPTGAE